MIGPPTGGRATCFQREEFFFLFLLDFSGVLKPVRIYIWFGHQLGKLTIRKNWTNKGILKKLRQAVFSKVVLFFTISQVKAKWKRFLELEICFEGPELSTLIMLLFVGEDACTCRLVAASKVQLWKVSCCCDQGLRAVFCLTLVKCHQMAFKWPGRWEKYCPYPYSEVYWFFPYFLLAMIQNIQFLLSPLPTNLELKLRTIKDS